jgi:adenosylcobinamide-GDP ribazoletransferase
MKDTQGLTGQGLAYRGTRAAGQGRVARILSEIRLAAGFLTIFPVLPRRPATRESIAASFGWFPLVGFAVGGALGVEDWLLGLLFGPVLRSALVVLSLAIITGAVHLDGLADAADALGAGRNRARALEIMRDSRIGSFGAIALFFVLGLKLFALSSLAGAHRWIAIYIAVGLARWAMVSVSYGLDYLRAGGAGAALLASHGGRNLSAACATAVIALVPVLSPRVLDAAVVAAIGALLIRALYGRWLGGVTGDLVGAAGEIIETAVLIAMSA